MTNSILRAPTTSNRRRSSASSSIMLYVFMAVCLIIWTTFHAYQIIIVMTHGNGREHGRNDKDQKSNANVRMRTKLAKASTILSGTSSGAASNSRTDRLNSLDRRQSNNNIDVDIKDDDKKMTLKQRKKMKEKKAKNVTALPPLLEIDITQYDDPPLVVDQVPIVDRNVQDFSSSSVNAVIVTKIQGPSSLRSLQQMLCLLTCAYNQHPRHDIIVFTSEVVDDDDIRKLQSTVGEEVSLRVVVDNPGLQTMVRSLSQKRQEDLLRRCGNLTSVDDLTWYATCTEVRSASTLNERLAYNWQAEFRALHLWTHDAIKQYKYMMWIDADAFCTRTWKQDPIATAVRYNLTLLFDHFPQGAARGSEFPTLTHRVFHKTICDVQLTENGTLSAKEGKCLGKKGSRIRQVHGFLHVTKLDFFRSTKVMEWNSAMINFGSKNEDDQSGDGRDDGIYRFSRLFDDQIGITIPAAVLAPTSSRDMKSMGVHLRVMHNYVLDGFMADWRGYFVPWWKRNANTSFPEATEHCIVDISG